MLLKAKIKSLKEPFNESFTYKVWLLLGVSFVVVSLFMGLVTWSSDRQASSTSESDGQVRGARFSDYLGKYFLYNVNVLTTHGNIPFTIATNSSINCLCIKEII